MNEFDKFYKKDVKTRREIIKNKYNIKELFVPLKEQNYDNMIENAITTFELPMGIVPRFKMNDKIYTIPMVTEEPSVIAAQSNAAKILGKHGGIKAKVLSNLMRGQIAFPNPKAEWLIYLSQNKDKLIDKSKEAHPSIVKRGGGVKELTFEIKERDGLTPFLILYAYVDTKEAMGANIINTIMEYLKLDLETEFDTRATMAILSNLATESLVEANFIIPVTSLKFSEEIGQRFKEANDLAHLDPYRATTHNKGVMNGIGALAIATGNDTRAIEAAVHAYASLGGQYHPLTSYRIEEGYIHGKIQCPITIGTVGGTLKLNPKAQLAHTILEKPNKEELMMLMASIGLAQNFAAIYALTTDGIQKGHMNLHLRALAIQEGAQDNEIKEVLKQLNNLVNKDSKTVQNILKSIRSKQ